MACKQWNQLPAKERGWTGSSYDNTGELSAITWRHVQFIDSGLNSFFLVLDEPEVYNLPTNPPRPSNIVVPASFWSNAAAMVLGLLGMLFFRE